MAAHPIPVSAGQGFAAAKTIRRDAERALALAVCKIQEDERRRLSRELHDSIGQTLTALVNQLQRIADDASARANIGLARRLDEALELTRGALQDTRQLSRLLRPTLLDDLGLEAALQWLVRSLAPSSPARIDFYSGLGAQRLGADLETVVFRITQEALSNAMRHAAASRIVVRLDCTPRRLRLDITDNGSGFDLASLDDPQFSAMHLGIRGMRDRAQIFGGRLELRTRPGRGTQLRLLLPEPLAPDVPPAAETLP